MARQRMGKNVVLVSAALGLVLPLLMGQGCCDGLLLLGLFGAGQLTDSRCPTLLNPLTVDAGNDLTVTLGGSVQFGASASGGTAPYTVNWSPTTGLSNPNTLAPTFTPVASGQFSFTIAVTDQAGCTISDSLVVTVSSDSGHDIGGDGDGGGAGNGGGDGDAGQAAPLAVDAGPDRIVTVGATVTLQGSVSGGVEPYTITWSPAAMLVGANSLTPSFTPTAAGDFTFTLRVTDAAAATQEDSVRITASQMTTLNSLTWGANYAAQGYQLLVEFSKPVDKASAERVSNYRVGGTDIYPASAVLGADGRTVTLVFSGPKFTSKSKFDIAAGDGVLDSNGTRVPAVRGLTPLSNAADTQAPTASAIRWAVNYAGSYGVEVVFSEAMDVATVESARAYRIQDGSVSAVGFDAVLGSDARTVSLVFHGVALSQAARLELGLLSLRDINGKALTRVDNLAISANSLDLDPPQIVPNSVRFVGNYAGGGYQVTLEYNEAMDRATAEDASAYTINGTPASSAVLGSEGRKMTLTWPATTLSADSKLTIGPGKVKDINGRYLPGQTNLTILPADSAGPVPSTPVLTWLKGTESTAFQFRARFNEAMDKATVENTANWRIAGTDIRPTSVVLSNQTAGEDIAGRTALVTFDDFGTSDQRMSRPTRIDVSVGNSIKNVNGDAMPQATCAINANIGDIIAPRLAAPRAGLTAAPMWGNAITTGYSGARIELSVVFSETMDGASATEPTNYYLAGMHPTSVAMDGTGRRLVLLFATTYGPIASADKLQILPNVRDINGHSVSLAGAVAIQANPDDQTPPAVLDLFWSTQRGPYQVTITFDEMMDAASATTVSAYRLADYMPTAATMLPDGRTLNLIFGNALLVPTDEFDIVGNVYDINGRAYDHARDAVLPGSPISRPESDVIGPSIATAVWAVDSLDYRVLVTFDEALPNDDMTTNSLSSYSVSGLPPSSAQLMPGGTTVELVFTDFSALIPPFAKTAQVTAIATDMHDNFGFDSASIKFNDLDTAGVPLETPTATWLPNVSLPEGGYELYVTFAGEVLDRNSAQDPANYRITDTNPPINPVAATLAPVDDLAAGVFAGRTVRLRFRDALSAASMLDASVGGGVVDLNNNGIPQASAIVIAPSPADTTAPAVVSLTAGALQGEWVVTYSEAMDWDTVTNVENYSITVIGDTGPVTYVPTRVWLAANGRTAYAQFTISRQNAIGGTFSIQAVTDINGVPLNGTYTKVLTAAPGG